MGEHGIATLQTTAIDQDIQTVSLTTVLAHSSGEWIASDWPVCALSDLSAPRRMGAALTYARRYALFTLVGIAGEDDLDAPDLGGQPAEGTSKGGNGFDAKRQTGSGADQPIGRFATSRNRWSPPKQALEAEKSAGLRDRMLAEIVALATQEQATTWAQKAMTAKNTLNTDDCRVVEAAFAAQVADLDDGDGVRQGTVGVNSPAVESKTTLHLRRQPATETKLPRTHLWAQKTSRMNSGLRERSTMRSLGTLTKARSRLANPAATVTVLTFGSCRRTRALSVAGDLRMPIICGSPSLALSVGA